MATSIHFAATFKNIPGGIVVPVCKAFAMSPSYATTTTDASKVSCKACAKAIGAVAAPKAAPAGSSVCPGCGKSVAVLANGKRAAHSPSVEVPGYGPGARTYKQNTRINHCREEMEHLRNA